MDHLLLLLPSVRHGLTYSLRVKSEGRGQSGKSSEGREMNERRQTDRPSVGREAKEWQEGLEFLPSASPFPVSPTTGSSSLL